MGNKMNPEDLVGQIYGDAKVEQYEGAKQKGKKIKHYYKCICLRKDCYGNICGNSIISERTRILAGDIKSCGKHLGIQNTNDIVGKMFGDWHVDKYIEKTSSGRFYQCTCMHKDALGNICGTTRKVIRSQLLNGNTKSCGCATKITLNDIVNKTFGYLKVDNYIGKTSKGHMYKCTCLYNNCGNTTEVIRDNLLAGKSKSCGCYRSKVTSERQLIDNPYDIIGNKYGFLIVNNYMGRNDKQRHMYECKCLNQTGGKICNKIFKAERFHILSGHTKSCGCYAVNTATTHGLYKHPLYYNYQCMKHRCTKPNDKSYAQYGGRGITVCERWLNEENGLQNFIDDMYQSYLIFKSDHPDEAITLDRKDVNDNYYKENCQWATPIMQANNKRNTQFYFYNNQSYTARELVQKFCNNEIGIDGFRSRLKKDCFCKNNIIINPDIFNPDYYKRRRIKS